MLFSPGEANSGYSSHADHHSSASVQATAPAPVPTYAFAAPAGSFAPSAPPPSYASEHFDSVAVSHAEGGHVLQPLQGFVAAAPASSSLSYTQVGNDYAPPPSYM